MSEDFYGIILAGGSGTRLHPVTQATSKQLLPIYDKPMIYYPLSTLMLAGIKNISIITTVEDKIGFERCLGNGNQYGLNISYVVQPKPDGLAQAFILCEEQIGSRKCCLILGDNIFFGDNLGRTIKSAMTDLVGAQIFTYKVNNPQRYGVVKYNDNGIVEKIVEKPDVPPSNRAVVGLYLYNNEVCSLAKTLEPSERGELEITDLNNLYLNKDELGCTSFERGTAWFDAGTFDAYLGANGFVQTIQKTQGLLICSPEEIAWRNGWISDSQLANLASNYMKSGYGRMLLDLL